MPMIFVDEWLSRLHNVESESPSFTLQLFKKIFPMFVVKRMKVSQIMSKETTLPCLYICCKRKPITKKCCYFFGTEDCQYHLHNFALWSAGESPVQSFALALLFCFSFNLDSLLIPQILETTFFFKTYLIFFLYFKNLLPLLWIIAAFFQLAVFPHIFSPQTKRQKLVKQAFRESHHVRFFLLKKICLDFFLLLTHWSPAFNFSQNLPLSFSPHPITFFLWLHPCIALDFNICDANSGSVSLLKFCLFLVVFGLYCCVQAFSSCSKQGLLLSCGVWVFHCGGFSCFGALAAGMWTQSLWHMGLFAQQHVESSLTRDQTHVLCIDRQILNHWSTGEIPTLAVLLGKHLFNLHINIFSLQTSHSLM